MVFLGSENEFVILVARRLKGGQVESRVRAFPKIFCVANSGAKSVECSSKPWAGWRLACGEFSDDRSMFVEQRRDSSNVGN